MKIRRILGLVLVFVFVTSFAYAEGAQVSDIASTTDTMPYAGCDGGSDVAVEARQDILEEIARQEAESELEAYTENLDGMLDGLNGPIDYAVFDDVNGDGITDEIVYGDDYIWVDWGHDDPATTTYSDQDGNGIPDMDPHPGYFDND